MLRHGLSVPHVTSPPPAIGLPWRAMPGPVRAKGTSCSAVPFSRAGRDRVGADEARGLLAAPAEAGLDRVAVLGEVVAVEVEADLEAQGVAGAEADRRGAGFGQRVPDRRRALRRHEQLDPVLARVAGAGDEDVVDAGDGRRDGAEPLRELAVGELRDQVARLRPLDGEHRVVVERVVDRDVVELARVLLEPREVLLVVARVGDGEEVVGPEAVGEEVVQDAAVGLGEDAVLRAVLGDLADVVGEDALQERLRVRPTGLDLAHVADVEHADLRPDRDVLLADAGVLHRHLPPGERHEPRPGGGMTIVQRSPLQRLGARAHRGRTLAALSECFSGYIAG